MPITTKGLLYLAATLALLGCSKNDAPSVAGDEAAEHSVQINVTAPADAPTLYLAGNLPVLGPWHPKALKLQGTGTTRTATISVPHGHMLEYKVTAGSWEREGLGPSGTLMPNFTAKIESDNTLEAKIYGFRVDPAVLIENWQGSGVEGELVYWLDVPSKFLQETRHVVTWLPPGFDAKAEKKYKVIYTHDGQNLFDPRMSYTNVDWGVDEAMMRGVRGGEYEPAIIVGVWNTPSRFSEYSPWHEGEQYARFLIEELMPRVEAEFPVLTGAENTFSMGSSMGGLISMYLVKEHSDKFGACGCVSTHLPLSEQVVASIFGGDVANANPVAYIARDIAQGATMPASARLYFDYGTEGLDASYGPQHNLVKQWLLGQGFVEGKNLKIKEFNGDDHNETAWRARVGEQLEWMLGSD